MSRVNKTFYVDHWNNAVASGTFLTAKHDPASIGTQYPGFRTVTVLSQPEIQQFLASGNYKLRHFYNTQHPNSPDYIEIIPMDNGFVSGSGIQPNSTTPTSACDRLVAVSGVQLGWHLFAEHSSNIQNKQASGSLQFNAEYL